MILQNTITGKKLVISRAEYVNNLIAFNRNGWVDITPPRSEKQISASRRFIVLGKLTRTLKNLRAVMRDESENLNFNQYQILNKTEIILQQVIKKHRGK
jgi:hypothetical protein